MKSILITGGTGLIGRALGSALAQAGYNLTVLSRRAGHLPFARVEVWDGTRVPKSLAGQPWEAVIHLAGAGIADRRWTEAYKQTLWESRIESTRAVVEWLHHYAPNARLLSVSAIGYYGSTLSQSELTESGPAGKDFLAGLAQAWEAEAHKAPGPLVIFRLGVVLSPHGGAWPKLRQGFRLGVGTYAAPGQQGFSWVHIEDVVRAFSWALETSREGIYNLTAPQPVSARQFAVAVQRLFGGWVLLPIPEVPLRWVLGEMAVTLTRGAYVRPARLLAEGFTFRYPTVEAALRQLLGRP